MGAAGAEVGVVRAWVHSAASLLASFGRPASDLTASALALSSRSRSGLEPCPLALQCRSEGPRQIALIIVRARSRISFKKKIKKEEGSQTSGATRLARLMTRKKQEGLLVYRRFFSTHEYRLF